jgi:hypothetical protein
MLSDHYIIQYLTRGEHRGCLNVLEIFSVLPDVGQGNRSTSPDRDPGVAEVATSELRTLVGLVVLRTGVAD